MNYTVTGRSKLRNVSTKSHAVVLAKGCHSACHDLWTNPSIPPMGDNICTSPKKGYHQTLSSVDHPTLLLPPRKTKVWYGKRTKALFIYDMFTKQKAINR